MVRIGQKVRVRFDRVSETLPLPRAKAKAKAQAQARARARIA